MIDLTNVSRRCACLASLLVSCVQAAPVEFVCSVQNDRAPVYVHRDATDGSLQRLIATTQKDRVYKIKYTQIPLGEINAMCAGGLNLAVMLKPKPTVSTLGDKQKVVYVLDNVPSHFAIVGWSYGGYSGVDGGFWVPASMPENHNAHITQFDVTESGFYNATNGAHLVHMLTASSTATIETEYQGKGMIFGPYGYFCGTGSAGASSPGGGSYGAISETFMYPTPTPPATAYANVNRSKIWAGADVSRDSFAASAAPYHTCFQQQPGVSVTYLAGANRAQGSVYYTKASSSGT